MSTTKVESINCNRNGSGFGIGNRIPVKEVLRQKGKRQRKPHKSMQARAKVVKVAPSHSKSPASLPFFGVSAYILHKSIMRFEMQLSHIMALSTTTALLTNQWSLAK